MAKQKIEIEIHIPDGYEFVRLDESCETRMPESTHGAVTVHGKNQYVIVRKSWQWPEWLTAEWIAMDKDGDWMAFSCLPKKSGSWWASDDIIAITLSGGKLAFTPPPCTDWTQSLRRNPKAEVAK